MGDIPGLFEMVSRKVQQNHRGLLELLINSFKEGGSRSLEAKIKEILRNIEEE